MPDRNCLNIEDKDSYKRHFNNFYGNFLYKGNFSGFTFFCEPHNDYTHSRIREYYGQWYKYRMKKGFVYKRQSLPELLQ